MAECGRKPRIECCCHPVAATRDAIVAPADVRSIAMMRACLVCGPVAGLDDACADRARDLGLLIFRAVERVAALGLVLGLVMGSSEGPAAPCAAPPQPRPAQITRQGQTPKRAST